MWERLNEANREVQGVERIELIVHLLWQIWKNKNQKLFNIDWQSNGEVVQKAVQEWIEYNQVNGKDCGKNNKETKDKFRKMRRGAYVLEVSKSRLVSK